MKCMHPSPVLSQAPTNYLVEGRHAIRIFNSTTLQWTYPRNAANTGVAQLLTPHWWEWKWDSERGAGGGGGGVQPALRHMHVRSPASHEPCKAGIWRDADANTFFACRYPTQLQLPDGRLVSYGGYYSLWGEPNPGMGENSGGRTLLTGSCSVHGFRA